MYLCICMCKQQSKPRLLTGRSKSRGDGEGGRREESGAHSEALTAAKPQSKRSKRSPNRTAIRICPSLTSQHGKRCVRIWVSFSWSLDEKINKKKKRKQLLAHSETRNKRAANATRRVASSRLVLSCVRPPQLPQPSLFRDDRYKHMRRKKRNKSNTKSTRNNKKKRYNNNSNKKLRAKKHKECLNVICMCFKQLLNTIYKHTHTQAHIGAYWPTHRRTDSGTDKHLSVSLCNWSMSAHGKMQWMNHRQPINQGCTAHTQSRLLPLCVFVMWRVITHNYPRILHQHEKPLKTRQVFILFYFIYFCCCL